ncbi:AMP-binding protein [Kineobactrum salinum]|uniref:Long-chain fatty acid--CoA ligase n=1 Tax=Kineobactrum salinum TaxID=2708301 RepID=A0A6C0U7Q8_9GAMM|nr:AMP-binding protein [Kineobactrum salinum]QIB65514.1 long-chain fatty acid--CoA ligase [Kineobactrum salinum]
MFDPAAAMFMLALTLRAATQVISPNLQLDEAVDVILEKGVTNTLLLPIMIHRMAHNPGLAKLSRTTLRQLNCVSSPADGKLLQSLGERMPTVKLTKIFTVPEMAPLISIAACDPRTARPKGAIGWPSLTTELRIVAVNGEEVPRGKTGELAVRGAGLMLGYWNRPAETAKAIREGWLHTGDAAYMDEAGEFFVIGKLRPGQAGNSIQE